MAVSMLFNPHVRYRFWSYYNGMSCAMAQRFSIATVVTPHTVCVLNDSANEWDEKSVYDRKSIIVCNLGVYSE